MSELTRVLELTGRKLQYPYCNGKTPAHDNSTPNSDVSSSSTRAMTRLVGRSLFVSLGAMQAVSRALIAIFSPHGS